MITSDGDLVQKYGFDIWNARDWDNDGIYVENSRSVYRLENDVKFDISEDEFYKVLEEYRLTKETAVDELKYWDLSDDNIEKYIK